LGEGRGGGVAEQRKNSPLYSQLFGYEKGEQKGELRR